jgi:hypothetical protein
VPFSPKKSVITVCRDPNVKLELKLNLKLKLWARQVGRARSGNMFTLFGYNIMSDKFLKSGKNKHITTSHMRFLEMAATEPI